MITRNMGRLDRALRLIAGAAIVLIGLLALGGWHGDGIGLAVAGLGLLPLVTSTTGFCPLYLPFGVSTLGDAGISQGRRGGAGGTEVPVK